MSRLVVPPTLAVFESSTMSGRRSNYATSEDYQSRLAKYIPAEATGGYVALDNLAQTVVKPTPPVATGQESLEGAAGAVGPMAAVPQALWDLVSWPGLIFFACFPSAQCTLCVCKHYEMNVRMSISEGKVREFWRIRLCSI